MQEELESAVLAEAEVSEEMHSLEIRLAERHIDTTVVIILENNDVNVSSIQNNVNICAGGAGICCAGRSRGERGDAHAGNPPC